jgi:hypothetical protein
MIQLVPQLRILYEKHSPYDPNTNSCVTHACDILRAGGVDAPKTTREGVRFIRKKGRLVRDTDEE